MSIHIIHLTGCTPTPLVNYLKAMAILRIVSKQADANARLWWENEHAVLVSTLDKEALISFFAKQYIPTPIIAPWNGGSGFYAKDNTTAIERLLNSKSERFQSYRETIATAKHILELMKLDTQPKDKQKTELLTKLKQTLRGTSSEWLTAVAVLTDEDTPKYPALLGTGGNDGRLEYTNNYMQRLNDVFELSKPDAPISKTAIPLLELSLFQSEPALGLQNAPIGFFAPGAAGGTNASTDFSGSSRINPWDYILMLEGSMMFSTGIIRKCNIEDLPHGSAPFEIYSESIGYGGAAADEDSRGEQWMPLWRTPASYHEVYELFEQGRIQLGNKTAKRPAEIARAIGRFGATRGITGFERYGYLERNGLAYLAVSLGRWSVSVQSHREVIDHAAEWLERNKRNLNSNKLTSLEKSASEALMSVLRNASPARWENLLIALGAFEAALGESAVSAAPAQYIRPLSKLPAEWLKILPTFQHSPELRLALCLANVCGVTAKSSATDESTERQKAYGQTLRGHFLPLEWNAQKEYWSDTRFSSSDIEYTAKTGRFLSDAKEILRRRILHMEHNQFPITSANKCYANIQDILSFLNGELNEDKLWALARPLMALDWKNVDRNDIDHTTINQSVTDCPALFALFRTAFPTESISIYDKQTEKRTEYLVPADALTLNLLLSGNIKSASQNAIRRLTSSGLRPNIQFVLSPQQFAQRIAASLLFPLDNKTLGNLAAKICRPTLAS